MASKLHDARGNSPILPAMRLAPETLARIDAIRARDTGQWGGPSRAQVARSALELGIAALESGAASCSGDSATKRRRARPKKAPIAPTVGDAEGGPPVLPVRDVPDPATEPDVDLDFPVGEETAVRP